jgi:hypothetical protein
MRSLMDFRKEGLEPIPAPADFHAMNFSLDFSMFMPGTHSLEMSRKAIHEYLGMLAILIHKRMFGWPGMSAVERARAALHPVPGAASLSLASTACFGRLSLLCSL